MTNPTQRGRQLRLALALVACFAATACTTPIGVSLADPRKVHRNLVQSALAGDEPSQFAQALLLRSALDEAYEDEPALTLERLRLDILWQNAPDHLFALAELSFLHADRTGSRAHYLAAAVYAYAFLFPEDSEASPDAFDPRLRLAADLYNRGITRGLGNAETDGVELRGGVHELPFGTLSIELDPQDLTWGPYALVDFQASADLEVHGLRNRYRHPGIGAPLAAGTQLVDSQNPPVTPIPNIVRLPVTALLLIDAPRAGIRNGRLTGRLELHAADSSPEVTVGERPVPIEIETSAALASTLTLSRFWESETAGFLGTIGIRPKDQYGQGLFMLHPYQPDRIPIVLVHGTHSSPGRWAELVNEVLGIALLRRHYQVWLFTYDTGQPVSYSAGLLREALERAVADLDPDGDDDTLRNMIVVGHSQGGLLTKLTSVSSGDRFWGYPRPFDELDLDPEAERVLRRSLFFEPLPFVRRVVFIATPHGGSYLTLWQAAKAVGSLVTLPVLMLDAVADAIARNPGLEEHETLREVPTSLDQMTPRNPFLQTLRALPIAPHVDAHSIVAVRGSGPKEEGNDGVVEYSSAHLPGLTSERVVRSSHSVQGHPAAIMEVGRILLLHLAELAEESGEIEPSLPDPEQIPAEPAAAALQP